jgi:hypothetical protein
VNVTANSLGVAEEPFDCNSASNASGSADSYSGSRAVSVRSRATATVSMTAIGAGVDAYWAVVAPAIEGLDPDQEKPTHSWLQDHDFRQLLYAPGSTTT